MAKNICSKATVPATLSASLERSRGQKANLNLPLPRITPNQGTQGSNLDIPTPTALPYMTPHNSSSLYATSRLPSSNIPQDQSSQHVEQSHHPSPRTQEHDSAQHPTSLNPPSHRPHSSTPPHPSIYPLPRPPHPTPLSNPEPNAEHQARPQPDIHCTWYRQISPTEFLQVGETIGPDREWKDVAEPANFSSTYFEAPGIVGRKRKVPGVKLKSGRADKKEQMGRASGKRQ